MTTNTTAARRRWLRQRRLILWSMACCLALWCVTYLILAQS